MAIGLSHAVAILLVSHSHHLIPVPTRQGWFWLEIGLAVLAWWPARWYVRRGLRLTCLRLVPSGRWLFVGPPLALGFVVSFWWSGTFTNNLWLHKPWLRAVLEVLLFASQAAVLAAGYAGLLAVTVAADRRDRPAPPTADEGGDRRVVAPALLPTRGRTATILSFVLFLTAANVFTAWYVSQERTLYYWDYIVYWTKTGDYADALRTSSPRAVWDHFRRSTQNDDYGLIPAALPSAAVAVAGDSRLVYILALVNLYLTALAATTYLFVRRFAPSAGTVGVVVPLLLVLLSPVAWVPLVRGYPDIGGAALATLALLVYLSRPAGELPWQRVLLLAGLLVGTVLFRRWYSFFVMAFFLVVGAETALAAGRELRRRGWREAVWQGTPLVLVGVWSVVLLVSFAAVWVWRVVSTDYAGVYLAYKTFDPLADRVWLVIDNCGVWCAAAAVLGFAVLLGFRDTRRPALVIGAMYPVMLFHFLRVQDFGPHHFYLFLPAYVLLPGLALARVLTDAPGWVRWLGVLGVAGTGIVAMTVMFVPAAQLLRDPLRPAVSRLYFPPLARGDLPEFCRLLRYTEGAASDTDGGKVAVVASSLAINGTMFLTADQSLGEPLIRSDRVLLGGEVDRVSDFPVLYVRADVLVVACPSQTHLRAEEQQAVIVTAESLLNRTDIGAAFDLLPEGFRLDGGVTVRVYRRVRAITREDFAAYCERLRQAHPDRPAFFTPPPGTEDYLRSPLSQ